MHNLGYRTVAFVTLLPAVLVQGCGSPDPDALPVPTATATAPAVIVAPSASPTPAATPAGAASPVMFGLEAPGVGDPNPYFQNGRYYVFYLQDEGRHPWRMSSSSDLSAWSAPIEAVPAGSAGDADYWTGSGSVVADPAGGYRIFYTGHLPGGDPQETTMSARASSLDGPWRKVATPRFSGSATYDRADFRDPFVLRDDATGAYWMLLTSRNAGKAAIALYTSPDLEQWTPAAPLYTESSPLNLEVPALFREGSDWFLVFSDQRDASRQTRYLRATAARGPYAYGPYDALDGRGFYAGKPTGDGADRLLFGWVANRKDRRDDGEWEWGGDLVAHALSRAADGSLAVDIAAPLARQFAQVTSRLTVDAPAAAPLDRATRIVTDVSVRSKDQFGLRFTANGATTATIEIDTAAQEARAVVGGRTSDAPRVAFPASSDGRYHVDVVLDPVRGFGILYLNRYRALSFRYYGIGGTTPALYATKGFLALDGEVRTK